MSPDLGPLPVSVCPGCGEELSEAFEPTDLAKRPSPGDISVCGYCGVISRFGDDLRLRPVTETELEELRSYQPEIAGAIDAAAPILAALRAAKARRDERKDQGARNDGQD